jgi:ribonuclease HI
MSRDISYISYQHKPQSAVSKDAIRNTRNHSHLIEEIRKKMTSLERANWNIKLSWIKAHAGIVGNELADRLAKAAASDVTLSSSSTDSDEHTDQQDTGRNKVEMAKRMGRVYKG